MADTDHEHTTTTTTTTTSTSSTTSGEPVEWSEPRAMNLPVVTLEDGTKAFQITMELSKDTTYEISDISVKSTEHHVYVEAKHTEKVDNRTSTRIIKRECSLPVGVDAKAAKAKLRNGNVLVLTMPLKDPNSMDGYTVVQE